MGFYTNSLEFGLRSAKWIVEVKDTWFSIRLALPKLISMKLALRC